MAPRHPIRHRLARGALTAGLAGLAGPASALGGEPRGLWLLAAGAGALTALATLASMLLVVQRLVRETRPANGERPISAADLDGRAAAHERRLARVSERLAEELRQVSESLGGELRRALYREAQSLGEGLRRDGQATVAAPCLRLYREIQGLPDDERRPLAVALLAAGRLGEWIERLWPVLQAAGDGDREAGPWRDESIARRLPAPAAGEWRAAARALRAFACSDAAALRRLLGAGPEAGPLPGPADVAFLESTGLLAGERSLTDRLKRYLEPFDHLGRLGEVTLALQYLVEAYPIEQLSQDRRARWRRELARTHRAAGADEDFHQLVAGVAAGVGLRYRPVPYYRSRTDQTDYAFVRQQVSPISLSERVGFEATADKEVIVRLERPFFFQLDTGIYYAGHAHVAR